MTPSFIYTVGKPSPQTDIKQKVHDLGYQLGILLDKHVTLKHPEMYDRVIPVDFEKIDKELDRLRTLDLNVQGLLCTYENYVTAKAKIGAYFQVPSQSLLSAQLATDKSLMRNAFLRADPSISPDYIAADTIDQALEFAGRVGYPVIIKPTNLVKSLLVLKCDTEGQLRERFSYAADTIGELYEKYNIYDREPQLIVEEFITGKQYSIAAFVDSDGRPVFCEGIVQLRNAQDIHVDDNYLYSRTLPADLPANVIDEMFSVADKGVRALDMRSTPAHIELMHGPSGVKIIEIGARIGGYRPRMYEYSYGIDMIAQEINLALDRAPEVQGTFSKFCAVYELFPEHEGIFEEITGADTTELFTYYRVTVKQGDRVGPAKNGFKAAAIVIITSDKSDHFDRLCRNLDSMKVKVQA